MSRKSLFATVLACILALTAFDLAGASSVYTHKPTPMVRLDGQSSTYNTYSWTWDVSQDYGDITSALLTLKFYDDDA